MTGKPLAYAFPISVELCGVFFIIIGIAIELSTGADLGYMFISLGSCLVALGSLIWSKIMKIQGKERNSFKGKSH